MNTNEKDLKMPGLRAPAFFVAAAIGAAFAISPLPAAAQLAVPMPTAQPPQSAVPVPGQLELSQMLWSSILAVDHANQSGNYSVLRDMSSQGFQISNNAANLAQAFSGLRNQRVNLTDALLVPPTYIDAPRIVQDNVLRLRGVFQIRPNSIYFDVHYIWEQGRWKIYGIELQAVQMLESMPDPQAPAATQPQQQPAPAAR